MFQIENMWSGGKNIGLLDRFSLVIPFCLDYIKCELFFKLSSLQFSLSFPGGLVQLCIV